MLLAVVAAVVVVLKVALPGSKSNDSPLVKATSVQEIEQHCSHSATGTTRRSRAGSSLHFSFLPK